MRQVCHIYRLGAVDYETAWRLQDRLAAEISIGERPATLLLLEHPHTFTFGRRGHVENLLWNEQELQERGVAVHWVDRGGDVTYHGPGQLVGYPLLPLPALNLSYQAQDDDPLVAPRAYPDYVGYVRRLEETLIATLLSFGVGSGQIPGMTGVWAQADVHSRCRRCPPAMRQLPAKLAAIGVKVDARGVTRHGFALNVNPDMSYWEGIVGCGIKDYPTASLADLLDPVPTFQSVMDICVVAFGTIFNLDVVEMADSLLT